MAGVTLAPFTGWPPEAFRWFRDLEANNTREWFQAHRVTYDEAVRGPMEALLAEAADEFGDGIVARPNRDTRFSADKSPYKLRCYARLPQAAGTFYVDVRVEGLFAGGGVYAPDRDGLAAIRRAIADDRTGAELEKVVAGLESDGAALLRDGALKTAPRGYRVDHPRIEYLRLPHLAGGIQWPPEPWLRTAAARDRIFAAWRSTRPLLDWAARALGAG
jgi:uncharacterized protein (TIGR02453 family)